ncbi:hypothetical protein T484DRAFT_1825126, partial [Baffinella frigidus]
MGGGSSKRLRAEKAAALTAPPPPVPTHPVPLPQKELPPPPALSKENVTSVVAASQDAAAAAAEEALDQKGALPPSISPQKGIQPPGLPSPGTGVLSPSVSPTSASVKSPGVRSPGKPSPMRSTSTESAFIAGEEEAGEEDAADDLWPVREWAAAAAAALTPARRGGACIRICGGDRVCGAALEGASEPGGEGWVRAAEQRWRVLHQRPHAGTVHGDPHEDPASPKQGSAPPTPGATGIPFSQHLGCLGLLCGLVPPRAPRGGGGGGGGKGGGGGDEAITVLLVAWVDPVVSRTALLARALAVPEHPLASELSIPAADAAGGGMGVRGHETGAKGDRVKHGDGEGHVVEGVEGAGGAGGAGSAERVGVLVLVEWQAE